jgi:hypothetical protein
MIRSSTVLASMIALLVPLMAIASQDEPKPDRTISTRVQMTLGGPREEVEMPVFTVPVNPLRLPASEVDLPDNDLVLGIVAGGKAVAYPVRYLALSEVVDDQIGDLPVAPTW